MDVMRRPERGSMEAKAAIFGSLTACPACELHAYHFRAFDLIMTECNRLF